MSVIRTRDQAPQIVPRRAVMERGAVPAAGMQVAAPSGMTARDIVSILRRRKWLIVTFVVLFSITAYVVTYLWRRYAPRYTAVAHLGVNPLQEGPFRTDQPEFAEVRAAGLKAAHAQMIKRESVLLRALDTPKVKRTDWYQRDPDGALRRLSEILSVSPARRASLIAITITAPAPLESDRVDLAEIANAVAEAYEVDVKTAASRSRLEHITRLQTKRAELEERSDTIRTEIARKKLPDMQIMYQRMRAQGSRLETLATQGIELGLSMTQVEASQKDLLDHAKAGTLAEMPEIRAMVENDPNIRALRAREFSLRSQLESLLKRVGPNHRSVLLIKTSLNSVQEQLAQATRDAVPVQAQFLKEQLLFKLESVTAQLLSIKEQVARIHDVVHVDLQRNLVAMRDLQAKERTIAENVRRINDTLLQLELLIRADRPVWVRAEATRPKTISMPKWAVTMPLGVLFGLAVGLGLAFLLELMDTSIKGPAELASRVDLPILGMIPHADDLEEDFEQMPLAFKEHPNSLICEAHRQIRTCLLFSGPPSRQRSLLISSQLPGDGRTTLTMNLAHSIAQGGRKVLVVDANFHQPAIAGLFPKKCSKQGLSNVLVGQGDWRQLVVEVEPNLEVLGSGPLPPNPAELVGSEQMREFIAEMSQTYDQVLFDGPPCLVVTDPVPLSTLVDGVVLVVRAGANTFGVVQRVRDMFLRVGAHVMGVVLNGVRVVAGGYLRKNYETFYEYREQAQLPSEQD